MSWSYRGCRGPSISGHAMGVGLCRGVRGSCHGGSHLSFSFVVMC